MVNCAWSVRDRVNLFIKVHVVRFWIIGDFWIAKTVSITHPYFGCCWEAIAVSMFLFSHSKPQASSKQLERTQLTIVGQKATSGHMVWWTATKNQRKGRKGMFVYLSKLCLFRHCFLASCWMPTQRWKVVNRFLILFCLHAALLQLLHHLYLRLWVSAFPDWILSLILLQEMQASTCVGAWLLAGFNSSL